MNGQPMWVPIVAALITGSAALVVGILAYFFGRLQKEHEVRFTRLYEKRAEVIAELYAPLHDLLRMFKLWSEYQDEGRTTKRNEQTQPIRDKLNTFYKTYQEKDIWITEDTWNKLHDFYTQVDERWVGTALPVEEESASAVVDDVRSWINESLPNLTDELKSEFRETLGLRMQQEGEPVLWQWARIVLGWLGASLIGLSLGVLFAHPIVGLCLGLGAGLVLEYLRPTRY